MTNSQRWKYGDWMLKAIAEKKRKQRQAPRKPTATDIFKYGISDNQKQDVVRVYSRKTGRTIFEAESYDEARRVLEEEYGAGA